jgi:hypothetical protein
MTVPSFGFSRRLAALFLSAKALSAARSHAAAHKDCHSLQELVKGKRLPETAGTHPLSPGKSGT